MPSDAAMPVEASPQARRRASALAYYYRNKKKCQEASKRWWKAHPEQLRAKWRMAALKNKVHRAVRRKAWRLENLQSVRAKNRDWQKKNWKHRQKYVSEYYQKNKGKLQKRTRDWFKQNRGRHMANVLRRCGRLKAQCSNPKAIDAYCRDIKVKPMVRCYYCSKMVSTKRIHFDHIIPLSKGGPHSVDNLCVSCAQCNLSKHASPIQDWYKLGQQILAL